MTAAKLEEGARLRDAWLRSANTPEWQQTRTAFADWLISNAISLIDAARASGAEKT